MPMKSKAFRGACLCGDVRVSFKGALDDAYFCHCVQCRKNYGMHGAFVGVERDKLVIENPRKMRLFKSSKSTMRAFCKRCGSPIFWDRNGYERIYVCMGLLDGKIAPRRIANIHTENKGAYYKLS
jgi:hypothetical protein